MLLLLTDRFHKITRACAAKSVPFSPSRCSTLIGHRGSPNKAEQGLWQSHGANNPFCALQEDGIWHGRIKEPRTALAFRSSPSDASLLLSCSARSTQRN